jgi:hypothetical protein
MVMIQGTLSLLALAACRSSSSHLSCSRRQGSPHVSTALYLYVGERFVTLRRKWEFKQREEKVRVQTLEEGEKKVGVQ